MEIGGGACARGSPRDWRLAGESRNRHSISEQSAQNPCNGRTDGNGACHLYIVMVSMMADKSQCIIFCAYWTVRVKKQGDEKLTARPQLVSIHYLALERETKTE